MTTPRNPNLPLVVILPGLDSTVPLRVSFYEALATELPTLPLLLPLGSVYSLNEAVDYFLPMLPKDRPFVLVGYSYTGPVAIRIAANPPPGLQGLILMATFAKLPLPVPFWLARLLIQPLAFRLPVPGFVISMLAGCSDKRVIQMLKEAKRAVPARTLARRLQACFDMDVRKELMEVKVPILNVLADNESLLPDLGEHEINELRPDAQTAIIPGGHALLECNPVLSAQAITEFVKSLPPVGGKGD